MRDWAGRRRFGGEDGIESDGGYLERAYPVAGLPPPKHGLGIQARGDEEEPIGSHLAVRATINYVEFENDGDCGFPRIESYRVWISDQA